MTKELTYYPSGLLKSECPLIDGKRHGKFVLYFENAQIEVEAIYENGKLSGLWKEWYENGQLAEEGEYQDGSYSVINFWDEGGQQLLTNGTGKTIRKLGASGFLIYEQYFSDGVFMGEKKLSNVSYGEFIPRQEDGQNP